jgi:uncharacterized protein YbjT (DUF2867 family)
MLTWEAVPPELVRAQVSVAQRLNASSLDIATSGIVVARHILASPGAGATVRDDGHVAVLERAASPPFTDAAPHRRTQRIPPWPGARAAAAALRATTKPATPPMTTPTSDGAVIDLARYAAAAQGRNTLR